MTLRTIANISSDFPTKFAVPRQSGLVGELVSRVIFCEEYRDVNALKGIEDFSHLWLIWGFSENPVREQWSPTVRPPRLGGNKRLGVFATRSPNRPNPIGLSLVELVGVEDTPQGSVLVVKGADLVDGTPIYDIKPYLPSADCVPSATGGFTDTVEFKTLTVEADEGVLDTFPVEKRQALLGVIAQDPRPQYQRDEGRVYGFPFAGFEVKFTVTGSTATVVSVTPVDGGYCGKA